MKEIEWLDDLEEKYEEAILDEFGKLTIEFQVKHGFENGSMIRLLEDVIKSIKSE